MKYLYILIFLCLVLSIYYFYNTFINYYIYYKPKFSGLCSRDFNYNKCNKLKKNYKIKVFNNFLTEEECDFFINFAKNKLTRSLVREKNSDILSNFRTSKNTWIDLNYNQITKKISKKSI